MTFRIPLTPFTRGNFATKIVTLSASIKAVRTILILVYHYTNNHARAGNFQNGLPITGKVLLPAERSMPVNPPGYWLFGLLN
jgi:hypothetical protein